jgi:hypothetical protein
MDDPLVVAAWIGESSNVKSLYRARKPDAATVEKAVLIAGQNGHQKVIETLLECRADVHSDAVARTLDVFVHQQERLEVVPMFLKYGMSAQSKVCSSIFEYSADKGKTAGAKTVRLLLTNGLRPNSEAGGKGLQLACQAGHLEIVTAILEAKADIHSHYSGLALRGAAIMGQEKVVKQLLEAGIVASSDEGNEALRCAVNIQNHTIVNLLLDAASDPSKSLPMAAFRSNVKLVKLLLKTQKERLKQIDYEHRAEQERAIAKSKRKAMKEAARFGHEAILNLLFEKGVETLCSEADSAIRMTESALIMNFEKPRTLSKKFGVLEALDAHGARRLLLPPKPETPPSSPCNRTKAPLVLSKKEIDAPRWHSAAAFGLSSKMRSLPSLRNTF